VKLARASINQALAAVTSPIAKLAMPSTASTVISMTWSGIRA
jgi:hypothetical protein